jgi:hypothetical protein
MLHLRPVEIYPLFYPSRECLAFEKVAIIERYGCDGVGLPCGPIIGLVMLFELNGEVWACNPILIVDVHGIPKFASVVRIEPRKGEPVAAVWTQIEFELRTFFKRWWSYQLAKQLVGASSQHNLAQQARRVPQPHHLSSSLYWQ